MFRIFQRFTIFCLETFVFYCLGLCTGVVGYSVWSCVSGVARERESEFTYEILDEDVYQNNNHRDRLWFCPIGDTIDTNAHTNCPCCSKKPHIWLKKVNRNQWIDYISAGRTCGCNHRIGVGARASMRAASTRQETRIIKNGSTYVKMPLGIFSMWFPICL